MNSTTSRGEPLRSRYGEHLIDQQVNLVAEHATECPNLASIPAGKMLLGLLSDTLMFHRWATYVNDPYVDEAIFVYRELRNAFEESIKTMNPHILGHTLAMLTTFIRDSQVQNIDFTSGVLAEDDIANASLLRDPNKRGTINNKSYSFEWELMNAARGVAKHIHDGVTKSSIPDTTDSERHDFLALTSEYCPSLASIESGQMLIGLVHTELYALEAGSYKGDMYNGVEISKMENFRSQAERALSRNSIELLEVCIETFKSWVDIETWTANQRKTTLDDGIMYLGRVVLTPDDIRYSLPENRRYTPSEGNQEKRVLSVNGKDFSWHTEMYVALRGIAAHIHTNTKTTGTVTENTRGHVAELTK